MGSSSYSLTIQVDPMNLASLKTPENEVVFGTLSDCNRDLCGRLSKQIKGWIAALTRFTPEDPRERDRRLRLVIDLKNHIASVRNRCEKLELRTLPVVEDDVLDEDDEFIDVSVDKTGFEAGPSSSGSDAQLALLSQLIEKRNAPESSNAGLKTIVVFGPNSVEYDEPLFEVDDKVPVARLGFDSIDTFWSTRDDSDPYLSKSVVSHLSKRAVNYVTSEPVLKFVCRRPLKNGGVCQERHKSHCPLHGHIDIGNVGLMKAALTVEGAPEPVAVGHLKSSMSTINEESGLPGSPERGRTKRGKKSMKEPRLMPLKVRPEASVRGRLTKRLSEGRSIKNKDADDPLSKRETPM